MQGCIDLCKQFSCVTKTCKNQINKLSQERLCRWGYYNCLGQAATVHFKVSRLQTIRKKECRQQLNIKTEIKAGKLYTYIVTQKNRITKTKSAK